MDRPSNFVMLLKLNPQEELALLGNEPGFQVRQPDGFIKN